MNQIIQEEGKGERGNQNSNKSYKCEICGGWMDFTGEFCQGLPVFSHRNKRKARRCSKIRINRDMTERANKLWDKIKEREEQEPERKRNKEGDLIEINEDGFEEIISEIKVDGETYEFNLDAEDRDEREMEEEKEEEEQENHTQEIGRSN